MAPRGIQLLEFSKDKCDYKKVATYLYNHGASANNIPAEMKFAKLSMINDESMD